MSDKPPRIDHEKTPSHLSETVTWRGNQKREILTHQLENGVVMVRIDARRHSVQLPAQFADEFDLPLNLSWKFANTAMILDSFGVTTTLRFASVPFRCALPWSSIWAVRLGNGVFQFFKSEVPPELHEALNDLEEAPPEEPVRPLLSIVSSTPPPLEEAAAPGETRALKTPSDEPPSPRAPWLKLVR